MRITLNNICKRYGKTQAADNVSFSFESGQIYGFIGPNGAGKTTTMKIMATLEEPDSGDVLFDDISLVNYPDKVRMFLGYMPDSLPEFKDIQVWEYLDFFARIYRLKGAARRRTLAEIEEFTNLGDIRTKYLNALSKGMKQRVSLARALVNNPSVMLLDEPAAGLDPRARLELRNLLKILADQGKAILISSHILSELQDICSGAVIIEKGKILASGALDTLGAGTSSHTEAGGAAAVPTVTLRITTLGDSEELRTRLLEQPGVSGATILSSTEVEAVYQGRDTDIPSFLGSLLAAGLPIVGFGKAQAELEEIFMKMTSGKVQ